MARMSIIVGLSVVVAVLGSGCADARGADRLVVESVVVPEGARTATVRVLLEDHPGTPLGADRGLSESIQGISLQFVAVPGRLARSITVEPLGVTPGGSDALFSSAVPRGMLVSFDASRRPLGVQTWRGGEGQEIARVTVELVDNLPTGTVIELALDPRTTILSNQRGTVSQTVANGALRLQPGRIAVGRDPVREPVSPDLR